MRRMPGMNIRSLPAWTNNAGFHVDMGPVPAVSRVDNRSRYGELWREARWLGDRAGAAGAPLRSPAHDARDGDRDRGRLAAGASRARPTLVHPPRSGKASCGSRGFLHFQPRLQPPRRRVRTMCIRHHRMKQVASAPHNSGHAWNKLCPDGSVDSCNRPYRTAHARRLRSRSPIPRARSPRGSSSSGRMHGEWAPFEVVAEAAECSVTLIPWLGTSEIDQLRAFSIRASGSV